MSHSLDLPSYYNTMGTDGEQGVKFRSLGSINNFLGRRRERKEREREEKNEESEAEKV